MKWTLIFILFISVSSIGQSLSPYFTRTRTLQLEGYSSVGVNIPYSYSGGSVNSWTINDTLADQWVNERINALLGGANFWKTDGDFNVPTGQKTVTFQGGTTQSYYEFALENTLFAIQGSTVGLQFYTNNAWGSGGPTLWGKANTRVQLTAGTGGVINELRLNGTSNAVFESTDSLPMMYNGNYTSKMINLRHIPDIGKVSQMIGDSVSGLPSFTANRVIISDGSGDIDASSTTTTQLGYLDATSSIQTQLNGKLTLGSNEIVGDDFFSMHTIDEEDNYVQWGVDGSGNSVSMLLSTSDGVSALSFDTFNKRLIYTDGEFVKRGIIYGGNYSAGIRANARSVPDMGIVREVIDSAINEIPGGGVSEAYVAQSIDSVDNANEIGYTPAVTGDWPNADPTTVQGGLDSLAEWNAGLRKLIVMLGDWNMQSTSTLDVNITGITSFDQIRSVSIIIRNDNNNTIYPLEKAEAGGVAVAGGWNYVTGTNTIRFERYSGAFFDSVSFDSTSFNRGWLTIEYVQ